ncbi:MAG: hypothetical protein ACLPN5_18420 [Roseiarcus sp.]
MWCSLAAAKGIGGVCECLAADSFGFCKHMAATALAANAAGGDVSDGEDPLERIRSFLQASSVDALVALILEAAERDETLMRRLDLASASVDADDAILEQRLRAALGEAIEPRGCIDYSEARDWAAGVDEALDAVEEFSDGPRAAMALRLSDYSIVALETAFQSIDDSSGHGGGLIERAADIHLAVARAAPLESVPLKTRNFSLRTRKRMWSPTANVDWTDWPDGVTARNRVSGPVRRPASRKEARIRLQMSWTSALLFAMMKLFGRRREAEINSEANSLATSS